MTKSLWSTVICLALFSQQSACLDPFDPYHHNGMCKVDSSNCTFELRATEALTMFYKNLFRVVADENGALYSYNDRNRTFQMSEVITADGYPKLVYVINNTLPGPVLNVYQGQTIRVTIYNDLLTESLSVHFHGIRQVDTPSSDGIGGVTQFSILPNSNFTHEFVAVDAGTFWYHSHIFTQTAMGILGAFIVHSKTVSTYGEFVLFLNDWQHFYTNEQHLLLVDSTQFYPDSLQSFRASNTIDYLEAIDGSRQAEAFITSILINGRGQYIDPMSTTNNFSTTPLETVNIATSNHSTYRIRLINGGHAFVLKFSIDGHPLQVISTDGVQFAQPYVVDQLIIGLGERYDVLINRTSTSNIDYWIRVDTLDKNNNPRWKARAVLKYTTANGMPTTTSRTCTSSQPCRILNCPFTQYGNDSNIVCLTLQNMTTRSDFVDQDLINETINVPIRKTISLTMTMADGNQAGFESLNYIGMKFPSMSVPILYNPSLARSLLPCPNETLTMSTTTKCYHNIVAKYGDIIEIFILNTDHHQHPMHLHGSYFHIINQGLGVLNSTTGQLIANNPDLECHGDGMCMCKANSACTKSTMRLVKDTVQVPIGGYMTLRFRATNPGIWLFHCHTEQHLDRGMALAFHIAEDRIRLSSSISTTIIINYILLVASLFTLQTI